GAAGGEGCRSPRRSRSRRCRDREGRSPASPSAGAPPTRRRQAPPIRETTPRRPRATPSSHHQRYDLEDYFNYYDCDYIEMDFNDEYNYNGVDTGEEPDHDYL
ncbi:unnamed protein product, partial [Urochloa humidicola]